MHKEEKLIQTEDCTLERCKRVLQKAVLEDFDFRLEV